MESNTLFLRNTNGSINASANELWMKTFGVLPNIQPTYYLVNKETNKLLSIGVLFTISKESCIKEELKIYLNTHKGHQHSVTPKKDSVTSTVAKVLLGYYKNNNYDKLYEFLDKKTNISDKLKYLKESGLDSVNFLCNIATEPEEQGRGYATELINNIIRLHKTDRSVICLCISKSKPIMDIQKAFSETNFWDCDFNRRLFTKILNEKIDWLSKNEIKETNTDEFNRRHDRYLQFYNRLGFKPIEDSDIDEYFCFRFRETNTTFRDYYKQKCSGVDAVKALLYQNGLYNCNFYTLTII